MSRQDIRPGKPVLYEEEPEEEQKIKVCLKKQEILEIIDQILKVTDKHENIRPQMSETLKKDLKIIGGGKLPESVERDVNDYEGKMEVFIAKMEKECQEEIPDQFKILNDNNKGIVTMIIKYGRETNFPELNKMLDLYDMMMYQKTLSKVKADYIVGQKLRNEYVNSRLNVNVDEIQEMDPEKVDLEKIQKDHPQMFQ